VWQKSHHRLTLHPCAICEFRSTARGFQRPRNLAVVFVPHVLLILHPATYLWGNFKKCVKQIPRLLKNKETASITRSQQFPEKKCRELTCSARILKAFGQEGNIFQRLLSTGSFIRLCEGYYRFDTVCNILRVLLLPSGRSLRRPGGRASGRRFSFNQEMVSPV
jgi:hypothetical protein